MKVRLFLLFFLFSIYSPGLQGPFVFDDTHTIQNNSGIQTWGNFLKIWTSNHYTSTNPGIWMYRPFTTATNSALWNLGGGSTFFFHTFQLLIFFFLCLLLFDIWSQLLPKLHRQVLIAGTFLFAINPANSQVVNYISASATLYAAFFVVLAIKCHLMFRDDYKKKWLLWGALCTVCAMLSKEEGVVVAALVPLIEIYLRHKENKGIFEKRILISFAAYILAAVIALALILLMFNELTNVTRGGISKTHYFITQWRAYIRYMVMYFFSYDLNADNLDFGFSFRMSEPKVLLALALNIIIIGFAFFKIRRWPAVTLAILWFYIGISPASSVVVLAEPVNDHRAFIGYLGFAIIGFLLLQLVYNKNRTWFMGAVILISFLYTTQTVQRARIWGSNERLWRDTAAKNPNSARAVNNLASGIMAEARYSEALDLLNRCAQLGPNYAHCYINRAIVNAALGRDAEAEKDFAIGVKLNQGGIQAKYRWAKFLLNRGMYTDAIKKLIELDAYTKGSSLDVRLDLIAAYKEIGSRDRARVLLTEAIETFGNRPELVKWHDNLYK